MFLILGAGLALPVKGLAQNGSSMTDCYDRARQQGLLDTDTALRLCCKQPTTAPADCFDQAVLQTDLGTNEAVELCSCANQPSKAVECYNHARHTTALGTGEIINMCSQKPPNIIPGYPGSSIYPYYYGPR